MKKQTVLWLILNLIFLIVFNAIFFLAGGTEHNASVWISYGFIHLAYIMLLITPLLTTRSKSSAVFGFALVSISSVYFFVEFAVSIIFIFVSSENWKVSFIIQLIIASFYAVALISNIIANEYTSESEKRSENEINYIKQATSKLYAMIKSTSDTKMAKTIEKIYDAVKSSPTRSHSSVFQMEQDLLDLINLLDTAVSNNDHNNAEQIKRQALQTVIQRNTNLKKSN